MRNFLWLTLFMFGWLLIELSFFGILLDTRTPLVLITLAIAFTLILGFRSGFWWAIGSALFFDILRGGTLTSLILFIATLSYATSFLARRVTLDTQEIHRWFFVPLPILGVILYALLNPPLDIRYLWDMLWVIPVWLAIMTTLTKLHAWLTWSGLAEFRGMRHT